MNTTWGPNRTGGRCPSLHLLAVGGAGTGTETETKRGVSAGGGCDEDNAGVKLTGGGCCILLEHPHLWPVSLWMIAVAAQLFVLLCVLCDASSEAHKGGWRLLLLVSGLRSSIGIVVGPLSASVVPEHGYCTIFGGLA